MNRSSLSVGLACLLAGGAAQAQVGATLDLGTTGVGAHLAFPVAPALNGRLGVCRTASDVKVARADTEATTDVRKEELP